MSSAKTLREQAASLFALAIRAREGGDPDYADILTRRAVMLLDQADEAEALSASGVPVPTRATDERPSQQQQQTQPLGDDNDI
jgi:hypothetical protein